MKFRALLLLTPVLFACPTENPPPMDGGTQPAPIVTSISPTMGPVAGGTSITINGTQFVTGASVAFGSTLSSSVTFESDRKLVAVSPSSASAGAVSIVVTNPGGRSSSLPNAFTYTGTTTVKTITEAVLVNDAAATATAPATVTVTANVAVPMTTNGAGQGSGVRAQVGFATTVSSPPAVTDFTWSDASYAGDVDGAMGGDLARDSYSGNFTLTNAGNYVVSARFSVDNGQSWTMADRDGAANGVAEAQFARVTVGAASIGWCKLGGQTVQQPQMVNLRGGVAGPIVYGQVFKEGVTNAVGQGTGIKGQLGYGAPGSSESTWTWIDATYNVDTGSGQNDEFQATLPNPGPGTFKFAFRFNSDDGAWTYCDSNGLDMGGFTEDQAGTLTVTAAGIDSCMFQFPTSFTTPEGRPSRLAYGRVFVAGVTEAAGQGAGIEGQLGYGAQDSMPSDPSWTWSANATLNIDDMGGGDEYQMRVTGPAPGNYSMAWRFRLTGGAWTYCDLDGSLNGVQVNQMPLLTTVPYDVNNCVVQATNAQQTGLPASTSAPYSVAVTVATLTDEMGQGTPLTVQIGSGATGSQPSTWTNWTAATYRSDVNTVSDLYDGTQLAPATPGTVDVAFRVQVGSRPFVYCDRDGSTNGYQAAQAATLTAATAFISDCRLQDVSQFAIASGSPVTIKARTLINGVSSLPGASPNLRMQVGVGPVNDNASTSALWGWKEAAYAQDVGGEDEFSVTVFPAYTGGRAVSARASLDGTTWRYCDLNGADGGYEVGQQYDVTVGNHAEFDFCNTQFPASADGGVTIYGQIYEPGLTPNATSPFLVQLGYGPETADPGLGWTWSNAAFGSTVSNNNEYTATLPLAAPAGQSYAFRYSIDGGIWCYGDRDGSQNGFTGGSNLGLVTP
ncbi:MAG: IPT/TIG domain-containing protein [Archangium sp.]